jgi:hypothetical protein
VLCLPQPRKLSGLIIFRQFNVAAPKAFGVDVHAHFASDKKSVFMDPGILALRDIGQAENPLP